MLITCGRRSADLAVTSHVNYLEISGVSRSFVRGGGGAQQIQLRTEDRENGDLGAIAPSQGFWSPL